MSVSKTQIETTASLDALYTSISNTITTSSNFLDVSNSDFTNGSLVVYPDFYILNGVKILRTTNQDNPLIIRLVEDIEFNPNAKTVDISAMDAGRVSADSEYAQIPDDGKYYMDLDFWGCIILAGVDHVMIDFNGHTIRQSLEHFTHQRSHYAHIQLSNVPYQGKYGYGLHEIPQSAVKPSRSIVITNGNGAKIQQELQYSSQYGIHGVGCEYIFVKGVGSTNNQRFTIQGAICGIHFEDSEKIYLEDVYVNAYEPFPNVYEERWTNARVLYKLMTRIRDSGLSEFTGTSLYGVDDTTENNLSTLYTIFQTHGDEIYNNLINGFIITEINANKTNFQTAIANFDANLKALYIRNTAKSDNQQYVSLINHHGIRITRGNDYQDVTYETSGPSTRSGVHIKGSIGAITYSYFTETICSYTSTRTEGVDPYDITKTGVDNLHRDIVGGIADIYPQKARQIGGIMGVTENISWKKTIDNGQTRYGINTFNPVLLTQILLDKIKVSVRTTLSISYGTDETKSKLPSSIVKMNGGVANRYDYVLFPYITDVAMPVLNCTSRGEFVKPCAGIYLDQIDYIFQETNQSSIEGVAVSADRSLGVTTQLISNWDDDTQVLSSIPIESSLFDITNSNGTYKQYIDGFGVIRSGQTNQGYVGSSSCCWLIGSCQNMVLNSNDYIYNSSSFGPVYGILLYGTNKNIYTTIQDGGNMDLETYNDTNKDDDEINSDIKDFAFKRPDVYVIGVEGSYSNLQQTISGDEPSLSVVNNAYTIFNVNPVLSRITYTYDSDKAIIYIDTNDIPQATRGFYDNNPEKNYDLIQSVINNILSAKLMDRFVFNAQSLRFDNRVIDSNGNVSIARSSDIIELSDMINGTQYYALLSASGDFVRVRYTDTTFLTVINQGDAGFEIQYPSGTYETGVQRGELRDYEGLRFSIGSWTGRWVGNEDTGGTGGDPPPEFYVRQIKPYGPTNNSARAKGYYMVSRLFKNEKGIGDYVQKTKKPASAGERILFLKLRNQRR